MNRVPNDGAVREESGHPPEDCLSNPEKMSSEASRCLENRGIDGPVIRENGARAKTQRKKLIESVVGMLKPKSRRRKRPPKVKRNDGLPPAKEDEARTSSPLRVEVCAETVEKENRGLDEQDIADKLGPTVAEDGNKGAKTEIVESQPKGKSQQVDAMTMAELEKNEVHPLTKSAENALFKFHCRLCSSRIENVAKSLKHVQSRKHLDNIKARELNTTIKYMPAPNKAQLEVITELVTAVSAENSLSEGDYRTKNAIVSNLNVKFQDRFEGCEFLLSGSSRSGFGLKGSDTNIVFKIPLKHDQAQTFLSLFDQLREEEKTTLFMKNVKSDFGREIPAISFGDVTTDCHCIITLNNLPSVQTSKLLGYYAGLDPRVRILGVAFRHWAKLCRLDMQEAGSFPCHAFDIMLVHFLQQTSPPVLPVMHELILDEDEIFLHPLELLKLWNCQNDRSVGSLWHGLFEFYAKEFTFKDMVVTIKQLQTVTTNQKSWKGQRFAIEDPYICKRNLSRNVNTQRMNDYVLMCLRLTYTYFGTPQTTTGPLFSKIQPELVDKTVKQKNHVAANGSTEKSDKTDVEKFMDMFAHVNAEPEQKDSAENDVEAKEDPVDPGKTVEETPQDPPAKDKSPVRCFVTPLQILELIAQVRKEDLKYTFEKDNFTSGKEPVLQCNECQKDGHLREVCPELKLPDLVPLPPLDARYLNLLGATLQDIANRHRPTGKEREIRNFILNELERFIRVLYDDARLELFGSSCNGFGFRNSDLDICLTFAGEKTGLGIDFGKIVETIAIRLRAHLDFHNVIPIPTAKVPIVKFTHVRSRIDCDISLYNSLAQQNTRMLFLYSEMDERVAILGYAMKYLAKLCDICDASRGSLSSYAYTIMVIFFLQQRNPPVIPVLQELYDNSKPVPINMIEEWNAWFFDDMDELDSVWPYKGKNSESVGELWMGMLKFYSEEFNFKEYVISIRQLKPLTRFEKLWNSKFFAIEDPFDLNHNLGGRVSRKMNNYIRKVFIRAREVFGIPPMFHLPAMNLEAYAFNQSRLTDGPPPNDGCCRICGKIGHFMRDCPRDRYHGNKNDRRAKNAPLLMHAGAPFLMNPQLFKGRPLIPNPMVHQIQQQMLNQMPMMNVNMNANALIPHMRNSPPRDFQNPHGPYGPGNFMRMPAPMLPHGAYPRMPAPENKREDSVPPPFGPKAPGQPNQSQRRPGNPVAPPYRSIPRFTAYQAQNPPQPFSGNFHQLNVNPLVQPGQLQFMNAGLLDAELLDQEHKKRDQQMGTYQSASHFPVPPPVRGTRQHPNAESNGTDAREDTAVAASAQGNPRSRDQHLVGVSSRRETPR